MERVRKGEIFRHSFGMGPSVDAEVYGLEPEQLILLCGETKGGKTLAATNIVNQCIKDGVRTLVITTEVSAMSYMLRLVSRQVKVPLSQMRDGMSDADRKRVNERLKENTRVELFIADRPLCTIDEIGQAIFESQPDVVVIDHLHRIQYPGENAVLGYKNLSLKIKHFAVVMGIPIVLLSQVTFNDGWRAVVNNQMVYYTERMHTRWGKEPIMEADKVIVLDNLGLHNPSRVGEANLIVHSMRDYPSGGVIPMKIKPEHQFLGDFQSYAKEYGSDGPS